jgi:uncharacterized protein
LLGRGLQETAHPSYQAWSYAELINDFNETVRHDALSASDITHAAEFISKDVQKPPALL